MFKNFNFYILFDGKWGHKIYNITRRFAIRFGNSPRYDELQELLGITNNDTTITPYEVGSEEYIEAANEYAKMDGNVKSNFIEDASFVKLREIGVRYSLKDWLPVLKLDKQISDIVVAFSVNILKHGQNTAVSILK